MAWLEFSHATPVIVVGDDECVCNEAVYFNGPSPHSCLHFNNRALEAFVCVFNVRWWITLILQNERGMERGRERLKRRGVERGMEKEREAITRGSPPPGSPQWWRARCTPAAALWFADGVPPYWRVWHTSVEHTQREVTHTHGHAEQDVRTAHDLSTVHPSMCVFVFILKWSLWQHW